MNKIYSHHSLLSFTLYYLLFIIILIPTSNVVAIIIDVGVSVVVVVVVVGSGGVVIINAIVVVITADTAAIYTAIIFIILGINYIQLFCLCYNQFLQRLNDCFLIINYLYMLFVNLFYFCRITRMVLTFLFTTRLQLFDMIHIYSSTPYSHYILTVIILY